MLKSDDKALVYDGITGPQESSVLWNAMIHPFLNMTIYGAIWYQGRFRLVVQNLVALRKRVHAIYRGFFSL